MEQVEIKREWKPIECYNGLYKLRNDGLLYSNPRKGTKGGYTYGSECEKGYLIFHLPNNTHKTAHKLVYETFIGEIPEGYDVHHKDGNKHNNFVANLELVEHKRHSIFHNSNETHIIQLSKNNEFIAEHQSIMEAQRKTGINHSKICMCCKGQRKTAGGYIWKYKEVA